MIPTSVTATPEHPGSHGSSENRRAWRLAASHRRRRRGARGFQNSRGIVCVRGEGGAGGGQELRGRSRRGRSSAGEPSGWAVFSVQPRNDKTQVFSFKTKKKKKAHLPAHPPSPHWPRTIFPKHKVQAHKHHPQICTHVINSLEPGGTAERLLRRASATGPSTFRRKHFE